MAEIKAQGRVIEARADVLVIRAGPEPVETTHEVKAHDAVPGDYVTIYDDGGVEVRGREAPDPVIAVPKAPEPGDL